MEFTHVVTEGWITWDWGDDESEVMKSDMMAFWDVLKFPYHTRFIEILPVRRGPLWYWKSMVFSWRILPPTKATLIANASISNCILIFEAIFNYLGRKIENQEIERVIEVLRCGLEFGVNEEVRIGRQLYSSTVAYQEKGRGNRGKVNAMDCEAVTEIERKLPGFITR
ncbi:hypothetical protein ACH5RR_034607 [Cinchona calisaya]|uniref:Uncharacterized protein n=1 Tax=Cinchona calisaya TaxID=153742 RepID=A0ABD2YCR1_9GENT